MKIYIHATLKNGPWGGGNQFLKALRNEFDKQSSYTSDVRVADVILFNSHQDALSLSYLKRKYPEKLFVHRIDGPISLYTGRTDIRDAITFSLNRAFADGTVFQSNWSKTHNSPIGLNLDTNSRVISNSPDPHIFFPNPQTKARRSANQKIRLVAVSWSANPNKGFEVYKYLDEHLDFKRYSMMFIGNTTVPFRNIEHIHPISSTALAKRLCRNDIFITASQKDPCSNSLIEALHCGLPAIALNDGGHPEIVKKGGLLFDGIHDVLEVIEKLSSKINFFSKNISTIPMERTAANYIRFAKQLNDLCISNRRNKMAPSILFELRLIGLISRSKITSLFS
jgi:glycosyltransferase involved in cell wall biosynthesis